MLMNFGKSKATREEGEKAVGSDGTEGGSRR